MENVLDHASLERAFAALGAEAVAAGKIIDIAVYGGSALILTFPGRVATKDVGAVVQNDAAWLRAAAQRVAAQNGWSADWLNDGVKGWLSHRDAEAKRLFRSYSSETDPGLRVYLAVPQYLFAMKCLAMRIGGVETTQDRADIEALAESLEITSAEAAIDIVARYYPSSRILPKTQLGIEEIFAERGARRSAEPETGQ
jgi:hypothetical protein